jgi:hypothetical protein
VTRKGIISPKHWDGTVNRDADQQAELNPIADSQAEMSLEEKSRYRNRLVLAFSLSLILSLGIPLPLLIEFRRLSHVWAQARGMVDLLILLFSTALFLSLPAVALFKILRRKRKSGSYFPSGGDLERYRKRAGTRQWGWERKAFAALCPILIGHYVFSIVAGWPGWTYPLLTATMSLATSLLIAVSLFLPRH